jgi:hypothetical protein
MLVRTKNVFLTFFVRVGNYHVTKCRPGMIGFSLNVITDTLIKLRLDSDFKFHSYVDYYVTLPQLFETIHFLK